jgi:hypothetical protein
MTYVDRFLRETASYGVLDVMLADIAVRVQLTPTDYRRAVAHYEAINEWLDREDSPLHGQVQLLYPQGGFMIGATIARHATDAEFDIDLMAQIAWAANIDPEVALSTLHDAIRSKPGSRYYTKAERKTRCSTVNYDGMHLDVTPAFRLASREEKTSYIFHSKPSDPKEPKLRLFANPFGSASISSPVRPPMRCSAVISRKRHSITIPCDFRRSPRPMPSRSPSRCQSIGNRGQLSVSSLSNAGAISVTIAAIPSFACRLRCFLLTTWQRTPTRPPRLLTNSSTRSSA